jgi:hypothetical protein
MVSYIQLNNNGGRFAMSENSREIFVLLSIVSLVIAAVIKVSPF